MIIFDRLQISDNGKVLYIDVHVNKASYFDNITIDKIVIQTQEQVSETDPLTPRSEYIYQYEAEEDTKDLHLAINANTDFENVYSTLSDKLLFVYVICKGIPDECTPCRLDEMTTLGVTFDEALFYQTAMGYTKELLQDCYVSQGFTDFILQWNAFKAAIETEHYIPAINFWNRLFNNTTSKLSAFRTKNCGCYG